MKGIPRRMGIRINKDETEDKNNYKRIKDNSKK